MIFREAMYYRKELTTEKLEELADALIEGHRGLTGIGSRPSNVYVVTCVNYMKIGVAEEPLRRLASMQSSCPYQLVLVATTKGNKFTEAKAHRALKAIHHMGEWFKRDGHVLDVFRGIGREYDCVVPPLRFWHGRSKQETIERGFNLSQRPELHFPPMPLWF
jgi:hypothetical protein